MPDRPFRLLVLVLCVFGASCRNGGTDDAADRIGMRRLTCLLTAFTLSCFGSATAHPVTAIGAGAGDIAELFENLRDEVTTYGRITPTESPRP